jgi:hypothetical protein
LQALHVFDDAGKDVCTMQASLAQWGMCFVATSPHEAEHSAKDSQQDARDKGRHQ